MRRCQACKSYNHVIIMLLIVAFANLTCFGYFLVAPGIDRIGPVMIRAHNTGVLVDVVNACGIVAFATALLTTIAILSWAGIDDLDEEDSIEDSLDIMTTTLPADGNTTIYVGQDMVRHVD